MAVNFTNKKIKIEHENESESAFSSNFHGGPSKPPTMANANEQDTKEDIKPPHENSSTAESERVSIYNTRRSI